jgi:serine/threonine protein kinase
VIHSGDIVGSYRVIEPVGKGGTGVVYLAEHVALARRVALKVLRGDAVDDEDAASRFFTEARLVNRIGHEHIVDITDFGTTQEGQCYFAMELLVGETLGQRLRSGGPFSLKRTLHVAVQIAGALTASHDVGIIHRDLKPENVFLIDRMGDVDFVKVLDFGLAKLLGTDAKGMPRTLQGTIQGTPHYMSPEQCLGRSDVDHRTDIYALGVILFQMVTGELPFNADGWGEVMLMHATVPFPSVRLRRPVLPELFEALVQRAVDKDRDKRFGTMVELRDALLGLLDSSYLPGATVALPTAETRRPEPVDSGRAEDAPTNLMAALANAPTLVTTAGRTVAGPVPMTERSLTPTAPLSVPGMSPTGPSAVEDDDYSAEEVTGSTLRSPAPRVPLGGARRWLGAGGALALLLGLTVGVARFAAHDGAGDDRAATDGGAAAAAASARTVRAAGSPGAAPPGPEADAAVADADASAVVPALAPGPGAGSPPPLADAVPVAPEVGPAAPAAATRAGRRIRGSSTRGPRLRVPRRTRQDARGGVRVPRTPANKYDVMDPD